MYTLSYQMKIYISLICMIVCYNSSGRVISKWFYKFYKNFIIFCCEVRSCWYIHLFWLFFFFLCKKLASSLAFVYFSFCTFWFKTFLDFRTTDLFWKIFLGRWWEPSSLYNIFNINYLCWKRSLCIPLDFVCCWLWRTAWTFCRC